MLENMKRIYNIGWIISGILLLAGCDISNRDNNSVGVIGLFYQ